MSVSTLNYLLFPYVAREFQEGASSPLFPSKGVAVGEKFPENFGEEGINASLRISCVTHSIEFPRTNIIITTTTIIAALTQQTRVIRWPRRCCPLASSHFEHLPDATDMQTDGRTPDRCNTLTAHRIENKR